MIRLSRLGERQRSALVVYVFDPCVEEDGDDPFPGALDGATLSVDEADVETAASRLVDASNSADEDRDPELRDALTAVLARLRPYRR